MGDWMISKKRFWGLALPIWTFEDGSFYVVGSKEELKDLAVEGWDKFEGNTPHRPWIDYIKIKHPDTGLDITLVTNNNTKEATLELLKEFNFPLTKKKTNN